MNDSMSILLAASILALSGLGLYLYKSSDHDKTEENDDEKDNYNEDSIFGNNFWGLNDDKDDNKDDNKDDSNEIYEEEIKPRKKSAKTQRNKKSVATSRRRY
jgi:hypothetical protein